MTLEQLNALAQDQFTGVLGGIFEHSPWVAERSWAQRPFASVAGLHGAMCACVAASDDAAKLALIQAHPQLAGRAAVRGELSEASATEQSGAGLDRCSPDEFTRLSDLNDEYEQRFGFPFIVAVRGMTRQGIIDDLGTRIGNTREQEMAESLRQIERIAQMRLIDLISE